MEDSNSDLESFRQQWRAEVSARSKIDSLKSNPKSSAAQSSNVIRRPPGSSSKSSAQKEQKEEEEGEELENGSNQRPHQAATHRVVNDAELLSGKTGPREPRSALEHYEKAVERENQGNLGDSLALYRKAFKMDDRVDVAYKNKHFPPSSFTKKPPTASSNTVAIASTSVKQSSDGPPKVQTISELIASFSGMSIEPAPPEIEGTPAPICYLASLPDEILTHILTELAVLDVASYARTAQVCKRLAFLVATEEQPWRRVCLGSEVGFAAMHYEWQTEIEGGPVIDPLETTNDDGPEDKGDGFEKTPPHNGPDMATILLKSAYSTSWRQMFRQRPRIRFNGCYISTVNYIRPGQASTNQLTWNSPVHIVTYFRYLRFFRDGTVLSLCTTAEPADVIPYLTKDFQDKNIKVKVDQSLQLPSHVMSSSHRGRWRLSTSSDNPEAEPKDAEGDVYVETEGVGQKYIYRMELTLRSVGKAARNNKLVWKGYWHYNKLTDDWGEFGLRNDKAFFWSRVKSWGMGA